MVVPTGCNVVMGCSVALGALSLCGVTYRTVPSGNASTGGIPSAQGSLTPGLTGVPSYDVAVGTSGLQRCTDLPSMLMPAGVFRQGAVGTTVWDPDGISTLSPHVGQVSVYTPARYQAVS
jgi:hypothetical protein